MGRVVERAEAARICQEARSGGRTIVFTNGCFDLIHRGHVDLLAAARELGDLLVVGLNRDASVRRLKGAGRPWMPEEDRAAVLAALAAVDLVVLFGEDTPRELIGELTPDILVKGGDYRVEAVVGRDLVEGHGGRVVIVPLTPGRSSTSLRSRVGSPGSDEESGSGPGPGGSVDTPSGGLIA